MDGIGYKRRRKKREKLKEKDWRRVAGKGPYHGPTILQTKQGEDGIFSSVVDGVYQGALLLLQGGYKNRISDKVTK